MGSNFQSIVDVEATAEEADDLADAILAWLVETGELPSVDAVSRNEVSIEGLVVITRRHVFSSVAGENEIECPYCRRVTFLDGDDRGRRMYDELSDTIGTWFEHGGRGEQPCPTCGKGVGLNDWIWSPPWGFGYLGFEFWNTTLTPQFKAEVSRRLGHRTVHPFGRL